MRRLAPLALAAMLCALSSQAGAAPLEDRLREQLRSTVTELRSAQDSLAAAVAERDALKARAQPSARPAAAAQSGRLKRELASVRAEASRAAAERAELQAQVEAAKAANTTLEAQLRDLRADRDRQTATVASRDGDLSVCRVKNAELLKVSRELLDRFQRSSVADVMLRKEPIIGAKRVQIETLAQTYGDRIYDQRLDVPPAKPSPAAPSPNQ